jgi:hypothetical protein
VDKIIEMKLIAVTEIEEKNIITSLKRKKKNASGYEGISNKNLKTLCKSHKPFTYIYNSSLISGIYPDRCKYAIKNEIKPIHLIIDQYHYYYNRQKFWRH